MVMGVLSKFRNQTELTA